MVHIKDEGSHFEAPIDIVWKYVQSEIDHSASHKGIRNRSMKPINENTMMISEERNMEGNWVKVTNRLTVLPPIGLAIETLEGPMAGSKFFNFYTPRGNKTEVTVVGEFNSAQIPPAQLEPAVRSYLEMVYNEDAEAIKQFASKK